MPTILLTDPEQRAALAATRALARSGWRVVTVGRSKGLAGRSRAASAHWALEPIATQSPTQYVNAIALIVQTENAVAVLPISDAASRMLLGQESVVGTRIVGPSAAAYARASDKSHLLMVAAEIGIRIPHQVTLEAHTSDRAPTSAMRNAVVVKPARSNIDIDGQSVGLGVRFVADIGDLDSALNKYPPEAYPILIQERTIGAGVGVFLLRLDGKTLLQFAHRRLREKPPAGGVSTYREAILPPLELVQQCEALLDALAYSGPAMIEFKHDSTTGEYVLMEINARLWGSLQLAIDAGVDFPSALVNSALGKPIDVQPPILLGTRSVWELGEVDHALALMRRTREELHAPRDMAVGLKAAFQALTDHRWSDHLEVFRWSDPLPFLAEAARWIRNR